MSSFLEGQSVVSFFLNDSNQLSVGNRHFVTFKLWERGCSSHVIASQISKAMQKINNVGMRLVQDGGVEGRALTPSCENTRITSNC